MRLASLSIMVAALTVVLTGCAREIKTTENDAFVRIVRDGYGVPHVFSNDRYGLYLGYGYAVAQDRLFQMEMARRSTQGLVAEVLGEAYLDYDIETRRLFSPASIRRQLAELEPQDMAVFAGFADGLNRWIETIDDAPAKLLPLQFSQLGFRPAPWTPYDVAMIFIGTMNNRYGDFNTELENAAVLAELVARHGELAGRNLFNLLNPRFTKNAPTTIPSADWSRPAYDSLSISAAMPAATLELAELTPSPATAGFSNVYLVGRAKASGAEAILVNGPQFGWFNPAYVYSVGLHGPDRAVVGNTPFAYPMIMFGHNDRIAWGSTWGASDIVDIFVEQLNPDNPKQYVYRGETVDFERRIERFLIKDREPVSIELLRSVHGPIVKMDEAAGVAYAKKRAWDGEELATLLAWLRATWASDWDEWKTEAARSAINVNMYYADVAGNIGYFHGGKFPRRQPGHDNRLPVSGSGYMDWGGRQSIDRANPHVLNPGTGFLANWNNKPGEGVMNPDFFFYSWSRADRVDYLNNALAAMDRITPDAAWDLLTGSSYADVYAPYLLPVLQGALAETDDQSMLDAYRMLEQWNQQSVDKDADGFYDQPATALFRRFVAALIEQVLKDDLGEVWPFYAATGYPTSQAPTAAGTNLPAGLKAIVEAADGAAGYDLFNGAGVDAVVRSAFAEAVAASREQPRLATAPRPFAHKNFLGIPQALDQELMTAPIEQNRGTENNMIVLRPGAIEGWEVTPPGQSGFIDPDGQRSPYYEDQFEMYHRFGRKRTWYYEADIEEQKRSETTLGYQRYGSPAAR
ncbi:MAG: penicillin acylase family protein [Pseudomonadota bacterium]